MARQGRWRAPHLAALPCIKQSVFLKRITSQASHAQPSQQGGKHLTPTHLQMRRLPPMAFYLQLSIMNEENKEPEWKVQLKGAFGSSHELSVIHKDNTHGRISWGWGCESKIILFSSGVGGNSTQDEEFAMKVAQILCDGLNSSNIMIP